jgi:hypothetical protein
MQRRARDAARGRAFAETTMSNKPELNHNVYILGAGFSVDGGLPLINNFLERMGDSLQWLDDKREIEAIQQVFRFRLSAAAAAYRAKINVENIEELFSLASATGGEEISGYITTAIAATLNFARSTATPVNCSCETDNVQPDGQTYLDNVRDRISLYQLYGEILDGKFCDEPLRTKNTVITFNYDTLLEDGLSESGIDFTYGFSKAFVEYQESSKCVQEETKRAIPIYKLHGSVNWSVESSLSDKLKVYEDYTAVRDSNERVLLLPPTWQKVFGGHLTEVLSKAVKALNEATRIIIIGFSMPPTDTHFKYLLAAGLQGNISLRKIMFVNPGFDENKKPEESKRLKDNLFSILRPELEERGIITLIPEETMQFLLTNGRRKEIQRNHPHQTTRIESRGIIRRAFD